ncbi:MAG: hypothetical protein PUB66_06720 [Oscillospiraceae bacterium]|nr:hypothetical protein [Oscillospiraceae bacterium]
MSMGIGCYTQKRFEDDKIVVYAYGAFDWNSEETANNDHIMDGEIKIDKTAFCNSDELSALIKYGKIIIQNSRFCRGKLKESDYDTTALSWIFKLHMYMKTHNSFPGKLSMLK